MSGMIPKYKLERLDLTGDLGGDPYDVGEGEIVMNARREIRIVCMSYSGSNSLRFLWVDPLTGIVTDEPVSTWSLWAGEQIWNLCNADGKGWKLRSPFANHVLVIPDPKPAGEAPKQ